jgi:zinc transporter ZupT
MIFLFFSIANLFFAPLIYGYVSAYPRVWNAIEKLTGLSIGFMVLGFLLPESVEHGGWTVLIGAGVGLCLPSLFERLCLPKASRIHLLSVILSLGGLCLHALMDGAALTMGGHSACHHDHGFLHLHALPMAVVIHQLPVGLFIWGLFLKETDKTKPWLILLMNGLATGLGFWIGEEYLGPIHDSAVLAYIQALFSGTLLHLVFDPHSPASPEAGCHHHHHNCHHEPPPSRKS